MLALSSSKFGCQRRFFYSSAPSLAYVGVCTYKCDRNAFSLSCFLLPWRILAADCCLKRRACFFKIFNGTALPFGIAFSGIYSLFYYSFEFSETAIHPHSSSFLILTLSLSITYCCLLVAGGLPGEHAFPPHSRAD